MAECFSGHWENVSLIMELKSSRRAEELSARKIGGRASGVLMNSSWYGHFQPIDNARTIAAGLPVVVVFPAETVH